jgi:hypothetical protein
MHQGTGYGYALWQPVYLDYTELAPPHVRAPYYGMVYVADLMGSAPDVRIKELYLLNQTLTAYMVFNSGVLAKLAVINMWAHNTTDTVEAPVAPIEVILPSDVQSVKVDILTGPGSDSYDGVTWGGMEWTYASQGVGVQVLNDSYTVDVVDGTVNLGIRASQALMLTMIRAETVNSTLPSDPTTPTNSTLPSDPTTPTNSTLPSDPTTPTNSTDPVDPIIPINATLPANDSTVYSRRNRPFFE